MTTSLGAVPWPAELLSPGVVTGPDNLRKIYQFARENDCKIPIVHCNSTHACNSALQQAVALEDEEGGDGVGGPIIVLRVSFANAATYSRSCLKLFKEETIEEDAEVTAAAIAGAVALAEHVHAAALQYGVTVILQSETRCLHRLTTWFQRGLLPANTDYFAKHGKPLFSSHLLDITAETVDEDEILAIAGKFLECVNRIDMWLEVEMGSTSTTTSSETDNETSFSVPGISNDKDKPKPSNNNNNGTMTVVSRSTPQHHLAVVEDAFKALSSAGTAFSITISSPGSLL